MFQQKFQKINILQKCQKSDVLKNVLNILPFQGYLSSFLEISVEPSAIYSVLSYPYAGPSKQGVLIKLSNHTFWIYSITKIGGYDFDLICVTIFP